MKVVQSASLNTIEDASYVFERQPDGNYILTKTRYSFGAQVGNMYTRAEAELFARINPGTLIIEGGNDMSTESATKDTTLNQRTITLVIIPQEVADAIDSLRTLGWDNAELIKAVVKGCYAGEIVSVVVRYASEELTTLLSALVNGYVVEKSSEELAHDAIRAEYKLKGAGVYEEGVEDGIKFTLDTLGIKITEVNA